MNGFFVTFQNTAKYLLLLYFIILRIKIDSNILAFLKITDENLVSINLQNLIIIDSFVKSSHFNYLDQLRLTANLKSSLNRILEQGTIPFTGEVRTNEIMEMIFETNSFLKTTNENTEYLKVTGNFNSMFNSLKKNLDSIK